MGLFGDTHGWGWPKMPPTLNLFCISHNDETWHSYTLHKEDPKYSIMWDAPWVLLVSAFCNEN